jgi:hypothetical protein
MTMARLSLTVRPELKILVSEIAKEKKTSPSRLISQYLEDLARKRKEQLMIKYYQDMANEHVDYANQSTDVIQKIASSWED